MFAPGETRHDGMEGYWCHAPDAASKVVQTCHDGERRHKMMCIGSECKPGGTSIHSLFHEGVVAPAKGSLRRKLRFNGEEAAHNLNTEPFGETKDFPIYKFKYGDSFRMDTLLKIANVTLDSKVDGGRSLRTGGGTLFLELDYRNGLNAEGSYSWIGAMTTPWHIESPDYTYTVRFLPHSTMNIDEIPDWMRTGVDDEQDMFKYTGVRLYLKQHGQIAIWDNFKVMLTFVSLASILSAIQWSLEKISMLSGYREIIVEKRGLG